MAGMAVDVREIVIAALLKVVVRINYWSSSTQDGAKR
jgi:hypothetical protein